VTYRYGNDIAVDSLCGLLTDRLMQIWSQGLSCRLPGYLYRTLSSHIYKYIYIYIYIHVAQPKYPVTHNLDDVPFLLYRRLCNWLYSVLCSSVKEKSLNDFYSYCIIPEQMSHVSANECKGEGLIPSNLASLCSSNEFASKTSNCGRVTVILTKTVTNISLRIMWYYPKLLPTYN